MRGFSGGQEQGAEVTKTTRTAGISVLLTDLGLMAAGLVDRVQVTLFPVVTGQTGADPVFGGAADFDLELIESRTLDGNIQELIYRPTLHI